MNEAILPAMTAIINQSLSEGCVPDTFKAAQVTPMLKKTNLDAGNMSNYRPVSFSVYFTLLVVKVKL